MSKISQSNTPPYSQQNKTASGQVHNLPSSQQQCSYEELVKYEDYQKNKIYEIIIEIEINGVKIIKDCKYIAFEEIDEGGYSIVKKSLCLNTNKMFALKIFKRNQLYKDQQEFNNFLNELNKIKLLSQNYNSDQKNNINWFNGVIDIGNYGIGYEYGDISLKKFITKLKLKKYRFKNIDIALFLKHFADSIYPFYKKGKYYTDIKLENIVLNILINKNSIIKNKNIKSYLPLVMGLVDISSFTENILQNGNHITRKYSDESIYNQEFINQQDQKIQQNRSEYSIIYSIVMTIKSILDDNSENLQTQDDGLKEFLDKNTIKQKDINEGQGPTQGFSVSDCPTNYKNLVKNEYENCLF